MVVGLIDLCHDCAWCFGWFGFGFGWYCWCARGLRGGFGVDDLVLVSVYCLCLFVI